MFSINRLHLLVNVESYLEFFLDIVLNEFRVQAYLKPIETAAHNNIYDTLTRYCLRKKKQKTNYTYTSFLSSETL